VMDPDPAAAVTVPAQVLFRPLGVLTTNPAGSASVKATPLSASVVFGFVMVKVTEVLWLSSILAAPNALVMLGGVATLRFADAVLPVPPFVDVTAPVVLVYCPAAAPVTVTLN